MLAVDGWLRTNDYGVKVFLAHFNVSLLSVEGNKKCASVVVDDSFCVVL